MIKVNRIDMPAVLREQADGRATQLRQVLDLGQVPPQGLVDAYRHPEVKGHLIREAHGKCIYCESKITHVYFGDVEHIKPKRAFPAEQLDIENLGLSCALCNNAKGDFWSADTPVLNPYVDAPDDEFLAIGYFIGRRPTHDRARVTIEKVALNRNALLERRKERIEMLQDLVDQYVRSSEGAVRQIIRDELCRHAADEGEYAFIVREYIRAACGLQCM